LSLDVSYRGRFRAIDTIGILTASAVDNSPLGRLFPLEKQRKM
jgi:hypothetical protein